jgi:glutamyl-Q tRNA(Asp) synthetase
MRVADEPVGFRDRLQGWREQRLECDVGDFVICRADGLFAYQLAVVVDDADQEITHVVRGADLLASTPRQIWLQRLLGLPTPAYLHHAVAILGNGEKLSKQTGAPSLPPRAMPTLLLAWRFLGQQEPPGAQLSVAEFWSWARRHWTPARLPPVAMLPAPAAGSLAV